MAGSVWGHGVPGRLRLGLAEVPLRRGVRSPPVSPGANGLGPWSIVRSEWWAKTIASSRAASASASWSWSQWNCVGSRLPPSPPVSAIESSATKRTPGAARTSSCPCRSRVAAPNPWPRAPRVSKCWAIHSALRSGRGARRPDGDGRGGAVERGAVGASRSARFAGSGRFGGSSPAAAAAASASPASRGVPVIFSQPVARPRARGCGAGCPGPGRRGCRTRRTTACRGRRAERLVRALEQAGEVAHRADARVVASFWAVGRVAGPSSPSEASGS